jgi:hypothetical protein
MQEDLITMMSSLAMTVAEEDAEMDKEEAQEAVATPRTRKLGNARISTGGRDRRRDALMVVIDAAIIAYNQRGLAEATATANLLSLKVGTTTTRGASSHTINRPSSPGNRGAPMLTASNNTQTSTPTRAPLPRVRVAEVVLAAMVAAEDALTATEDAVRVVEGRRPTRKRRISPRPNSISN